MSGMRRLFRPLAAALLLLQLLLPASGLAAPPPQENDPELRAQSLLNRLTPEERVGQLFLVSFNGTDVSPESQIYDLIASRHVGGVALSARDDNFLAPPDTVAAAWTLIRELQTIELQASNQQQTGPNGEPFSPAYIPLFVAISQEGNGYPYGQILTGLTPQPSAMALGATWQPDLARLAGEVLGGELAALGFNLLLGPSLDVLENPNPERPGDIGARSFGGDPYWVGQMGSAFVSGVHAGSQNGVAVVGKHFPGHGGSNRPPEEEVPTVRKSLAQLTQIELAPFFAVTGEAPSQGAAVDALLLSHIRYQGFQGNIRAQTNPVSFDRAAFTELMNLEQFATWRAGGGVIISDQLGTRAVRRFYDPTEQTFNAHLVARDAFLAGNDLLYLGNFIATDDPDSYATIIRTLDFFAQKYRDDVAFAQRVDESVLRLMTLKFRLYENFLPNEVMPPEAGLAEVGRSSQVTFEVARQAATLLSPSAVELGTELPVTPGFDDQIVIVTDSYEVSQCTGCPAQEALPKQALAQAIARLYGPSAGGQIVPQNIASYTFADLQDILADRTRYTPLLGDLRLAEWVLFAMQDVRAERPTSQALRRFLSERPDLLQRKRVVLFAFNTPYYLDATDISKLTAYYGLYSRQPQFVDVAARLLFKEIPTPGASPVSIPGLGYDLIEVTSPNPEQIIPLTVRLVGSQPAAEFTTPQPEAPRQLSVGDSLTLQAGMIVDHNGHQVPDNTPVRFVLVTSTEGGAVQREFSAVTLDGVAQVSINMETPGSLEMRVVSGDPAASSETFTFEVLGEGGAPPASPEATEEASPGAETTLPPSEEEPRPPHTETTFGDWLLTLTVSVAVSVVAYQAGALSGRVRWGMRWALSALLGGLLVNAYLSFGLPGSVWLLESVGIWGVVLASALGAGLGWTAGFSWERLGKGGKSEGLSQ